MDQVLNVSDIRMKPTCKPIVFLLLLAFTTLQCSRKYDLVISGGTLYDGSGRAPFLNAAVSVAVDNAVIAFALLS